MALLTTPKLTDSDETHARRLAGVFVVAESAACLRRCDESLRFLVACQKKDRGG